MMGPTLGSGFSLVAGSMVVSFADNLRLHLAVFEHLPTWQLAFVMVGIPGFLLAAVLLTVREPTRTQMLRASSDARHFTLREARSFLWKRRGFYGNIYVGVGMLGIVVLGMPAWLPAFLIRHHGFSPATLGYRFGLLVIVFGAAGVLIGPWVAQYLQRKGYKDASLRASAASIFFLAICCTAIPLAPTGSAALAAIAAAFFFSMLPTGILAAAMQIGTPSRLRGVVASLYTFFAQLIGYGVGPTAIAVLTDKGFGDPKMVGYSIGIVGFVAAFLSAWLMVAALGPYRKLLQEEADAGGH